MDKGVFLRDRGSETKVKSKDTHFKNRPTKSQVEGKVEDERAAKAAWDESQGKDSGRNGWDAGGRDSARPKILSKRDQRKEKQKQKEKAKTPQSSQNVASLAGQTEDGTKGTHTSALNKERSKKSQGISKG